MPPRLSVVIPTRDCLPYLPAAISSVRAQTCGPIEIVVVDDGSTDGTDGWLAAAAAQDPLLKPVVHAPAGVAAARNAGIAAAGADIIAFLDADDTYEPGALADRLDLMERDPGISLTFADFTTVAPDGRPLGVHFSYWPLFRTWLSGRTGTLPLGADAFHMLLAEPICGTSTVIARRGAIAKVGGFSERYRICEDWDLWLKLSRTGSVWCSTVMATRYLRRPGSTSRNTEELARCVHRIFADHAPDLSKIPPPYRNVARARILAMDAEVSRERDHRLAALARQGLACLLAPGRVAARDAARDVARLLRLK